MKKRFVLFSLFFLFLGGMSVRSQVMPMYSQGFESGESAAYSVTPSNGSQVSTVVYSSGSKSIRLKQLSSGEVEFVIGPIDFTQDLTLRYIALRFDHICRVKNGGSCGNDMAKIYFKRENQSDNQWQQATSQHYDLAESHGTTNFTSVSNSYFNSGSYADWNCNGTTVDNSQWKRERFNFNNIITSSVATNERKLMIKFVLKGCDATSTFDTASLGWWLDNIVVSASQDPMIAPKISMVNYPDGGAYPNSRGARIIMKVSTSLAAGIASDSSHLFYRVGSDPTEVRVEMAPVAGAENQFMGWIPFFGYDTAMYFRCVANDATSNYTEARFPSQEAGWIEYHYTRGTEQLGVQTQPLVPTSNSEFFPLPYFADNKSEWIYNKNFLESAGYGPGAMTALKLQLMAVNKAHTRNRFQLRMANVDSGYYYDGSVLQPPYYSDYMCVVYDQQLTLPAMNAGQFINFPFIDTFYYAGNDLLVQVIYDNDVDIDTSGHVKTKIGTVACAPDAAGNKCRKTKWFFGGQAFYGYDLFTNDQMPSANAKDEKRPAPVITQYANMPLLYDAGVSELVKPNFDNPIMFHPDSIKVKLKNYGAMPISAIRISYSIDDTINGYFDWTGNLAAGAEQAVLLTGNIDVPAGFHNICAWVEDSLMSGGNKYRDHEPFNDTVCSQFIVCEGPMSGVRNIGGDNSDFNNMEEFLFTLSRCGVNDSLVVRLAPGYYEPFILPTVPGLSQQNYIVLESMDGDNRAVVYADASTTATALLNLEAVHDMRLRKLDFVRREGGLLTDMVRLGDNSNRISIDDCRFIDSIANPTAAQRIAQLINSGNADYLSVTGCDLRGGNYGVNISGMAVDIRSTGNSVENCVFHNQYTSAIRIENQTNIVIDSNQLYDVMSNSNYVLMVAACDGNVRVTRNKVYTSHGAGAIAVNNVTGTQANHALVANNMVVSNYMGNANMFTSINIIQAAWTDVVYNSVSFNAPMRSNVAAATFGGGMLSNCRFLNNMVASFDNVNYALWYNPGNGTGNEVAHNIYFSNGSVLNRKGTSACNNFTAWLAAMPSDTNSVVVNPVYLNGGLVDLRTFNPQVKGIGTPLANVETDMFGNERSSVAPCPGAFEFVSLDYDFELVSLVNPPASDCYMPDQTELQLEIRNNGVLPLAPGSSATLAIGYTINGGAAQESVVSATVPADGMAQVNTGIMLHLPANGLLDSVYNLVIWTASPNDPNQTNDTAMFTVVSRYHSQAPANTTVQVEYANDITIVPTEGIITWPVYNSDEAPMQPSQIYWYYDSTDNAPFHVGHSYTMEDVHENTTFHIRQHRNVPIVRITELETKHTSSDAGVMNPMPSWLVSSRKAAIQLTNVGDGPAYLAGDSLIAYIKTGTNASTLSYYRYGFGDVVLQPGQSLVLQYVAAGQPAVDYTILTGLTPTISNTANVAFIYKNSDGEIVDALPLNGSITIAGSPWSSFGVPDYVWSGDSKSFTNSISGMKRVAFNGDALDWANSSAASPMTLGYCDPAWIRYVDNGCEGLYGEVNVEVQGFPTVELALSDLVLPPDGCGLGNENITVSVHNYGIEQSGPFIVNYSDGTDTVTETVPNGVPSAGVVTYTFDAPLNFAHDNDTTISVRVWLTAYEGDNLHYNDTVFGSVLSLYTPLPPVDFADREVEYATRDTVTYIPLDPGVIPIWYDYDGNPVDTGTTHITEILYGDGTMGISLSVLKSENVQINEGSTQSTDTDPNPFNVKNKNARQQYIYTADELLTAGCAPGPLSRIFFYLDTIGNPASSTLLDYHIGMGATSDAAFSGGSDWHATDLVYSADELVIADAMDHDWVQFDLDSAFNWDGVSNIVVEVSYHLTAGVNNGAKSLYGLKDNSTLHKYASSAISPTTTGTKGNKRPIVMFNHDYLGCSSPVTNYNVTLLNVPAVDAAVFWYATDEPVYYNSCDPVALPLNVRNQGSTQLDSVKFYYWLDTAAMDSSLVYCSIVGGHTDNLQLFSKVLTPGRHTVTAVLGVEGDNIGNNDTVSGMFTVRFCGGTYSISAADADYHSVSEAVDTLNAVGIEGPVYFLVGDGVYSELVALHEVEGSSPVNRITFSGVGDSAILSVSTSQQLPNAVTLDGASNLRFFKMVFDARPEASNVNFANALSIAGGDNIQFDSCRFSVKGSIVNASASCVVLGSGVTHLSFRNSEFDSGYYAITGIDGGYGNICIEDNLLSEFASGGVRLRGVQNLLVNRNYIVSSNGSTSSSSGRPNTGLFLAEVTDTFMVQKNHINLIDQSVGGKRGIQLANIVCTNPNQGYVVNNMISTQSNGSKNGTANFPSCGVWVDSSTYVNIFFNSIRVYGTTATNAGASGLSYAFHNGSTSTNLQVMNNIFSNFSYGYAYHVTGTESVSTSDFNAFYTLSAKKFAWGTNENIATLAALSNLSDNDHNSIEEEPVFVSTEDLHLLLTNLTDKGQYNTEVPDDIDGNPRHQINPAPTVGAHEMPREAHDMVVELIIKPTVPASPLNIESDSVQVIATFYNNGSSTETNVRWYAYIEGYEDDAVTEIKNMGSFVPSSRKTDTLMIPTHLGIIDTHVVHVVVLDDLDTILDNNEKTAPLYLAPAFNFKVEQMIVENSVSPTGCDMRNAQVKIKLKNVGQKPFPEGTVIKIGYHPEITQPAGLQIATMPDTVEQFYTLESAVPTTGAASTIIIPFSSTTNLYPTDTAVNIKVRMKGWYHYQYDITRTNDSTDNSSSQSPVKDSYYTPAPPVGHDTTLAYGTWGAVTAEQENGWPVRWYADSNSSSVLYTHSNYATSCTWSGTPQYFDSCVYYLMCKNKISNDVQCPSHFSKVTVHVAPRIPNDVGFVSEPTYNQAVISPAGGRVYMENDTVRVVVTNFGTSPQSNIPITYRLKKGATLLQTVTETIPATIAAGQNYTYTFDSLLTITTPTDSANYTLLVWTELGTDGTRRNDTIRANYTFYSQKVAKYNTFNYTPTSADTKFDITRLSWNGIDLDLPPLNRDYTNMAIYPPTAEEPVLHVTRGTTDSILIEITPMDQNVQRFRLRATVEIDFDRDGLMTASSGPCNEKVISGMMFWNDSVFRSTVTIPECASLGYMRMRVYVKGYDPDNTEGHVIDLLLFVDDDVDYNDIHIAQIVSPRSYLIRDDAPKVVSFRVLNRGRDPLTECNFFYRFIGDTIDPTANGEVAWQGNLQPGHSMVVSLPEHHFPLGTSTLSIWHELEDDAVHSNDTLTYEYHRFHTIRLPLSDNFEGIDRWYAPTGNSVYSRNYWQRGAPSKTKIDTAYSGVNAWVTDLENNIVSGKRGNVSYLYSPIINIAMLKADTISFRLQRNLLNGSSLHLEFINYQGQWVKVDPDSVNTWYNDDENRVWVGTTPGNTYTRYYISTSATRVNGDFPEHLQFRFVYQTPIGTSATTAFGEGCAIDNFYISRARIQIDVGVTAITEPVAPRYGETVYPRVTVHNFGYDTVHSIHMEYVHYSNNLPKDAEIPCLLPPDADTSLVFPTGFVVTSDYPDTFYITAYTNTMSDIIRDNDTLTKYFPLAPLDNDISATSFVTPLDRVIAGDSTVVVTMRVRNFGVNPISRATASYIVNGQNRVDEEVDFVSLLGHPLESMQYYNYTFNRPFRASMGIMQLVGIIKCDSNEYIYNDTISKRIQGITTVVDIAAASVIVDTSSFNEVRIQLVIENRGARGANGFEVGFWVDGDTSTMFKEIYGRDLPIPALSTGYHLFDTALATRAARYENVVAFVNIDGDNDRSNDTTTVITRQFTDLEILKVIVEENSNAECRVFAKVRNVGNLSHIGESAIQLSATINGQTIRYNAFHRVEPGQIVTLEFERTIPKDPLRHYTGTGSFTLVGDANEVNNQTSIIEVVNYVEGIPYVDADRMVLDQNYPNPFTGVTTIPFSLPEAAQVRLFIIDAMGHCVYSSTAVYPAGASSVNVDLGPYSSGIYYYGIEALGERRMKKMIMK